MPRVPFPRPIRCAVAFRLCCWSLLVAVELEPGAVDVTVDMSVVVVVSAVEGGKANVAEADVDVTGGAVAPVGVMGGEVTVTELSP